MRRIVWLQSGFDEGFQGQERKLKPIIIVKLILE